MPAGRSPCSQASTACTAARADGRQGGSGSIAGSPTASFSPGGGRPRRRRASAVVPSTAATTPTRCGRRGSCSAGGAGRAPRRRLRPSPHGVAAAADAGGEGGRGGTEPWDRQAAAATDGCDSARSNAADERAAGRHRVVYHGIRGEHINDSGSGSRRCDRPGGDRGGVPGSGPLLGRTTTWSRRGNCGRRRRPVGAANRSRSRSPSTTTSGRTSRWRCRSSASAGAPATFFLTGASLQGPASFWWERLDRRWTPTRVGSCSGPTIPAVRSRGRRPARERARGALRRAARAPRGRGGPQRAALRAGRRTRRGRLRDRLPHP